MTLDIEALKELAGRATGWQPIETAPKDGTEVELTWMDDGKPTEIWPMRWNAFAENPMVQDGKGIWAMHSRTTNELFMTWTDHDPAGAPTHWRFPTPPANKEG